MNKLKREEKQDEELTELRAQVIQEIIEYCLDQAVPHGSGPYEIEDVIFRLSKKDIEYLKEETGAWIVAVYDIYRRIYRRNKKVLNKWADEIFRNA